MKIRIIIGEVELTYEQEAQEKEYVAATTEDGYSKGNSQKQLMATIRGMAETAKEMHNGMYDT